MEWTPFVCDRRYNRGTAGQTIRICEAISGSGRKKDSSASLLYDIENDWIADAAIDPYPTPDRAQAMRHILRLKELGIASQSLVLFDLPYEQFMPLYFRRWPVETKYDILKNKLELCNFTGCMNV